MSFRMPAEWEPHERTLMAWPLHPSWGRHLEAARQTYAGLAGTVAGFEPPMIPGAMCSYSGGGPHCATMQISESGGAS